MKSFETVKANLSHIFCDRHEKFAHKKKHKRTFCNKAIEFVSFKTGFSLTLTRSSCYRRQAFLFYELLKSNGNFL